MTAAAPGSVTDRESYRQAIFPYDGSTFNEVKEAAFSGTYAELPYHQGLTPRRFVEFLNDSSRNLIDRRDILPRFDKLIHSNGICFTGVWRIDGESRYTGYFAPGSEGLLLVRGSVAGNKLNAGERRAFGFGGKVWPTMDPDEKFMPGNFVTVTTLSGERKQHITDYMPTNNPKRGLDPGANFVSRIIFRMMDSRPGWRQLYPMSTLGLPRDAPVITPDLMLLKLAEGTPQVDARDFRDELRLEHYPGHKLAYTINVKDFGDRVWSRIGSLEFTDYAISEGQDKRLHFWIPRDVTQWP
ncbi:MAG: hypothetical protein M3296_11140 [Actinomycetota bacterium]|nr:hypothetical protein [Actinomycetota bacterium]